MITLQQIRDKRPCREGWAKLLVCLGGTSGNYDPDRQVTLGDVAASNGAADAWWCVRCLDTTDAMLRRRIVRALLPACRRVATHTTDARVAYCLAAVARWVEGDDAVDLKTAARAARAAARAARAAARAARAAAAYTATDAAAAYAAAYATDAAAYATDVTDATDAAAAYATDAAAYAAAYATDAPEKERATQVADIIAEFGLTQTKG